MRNSNLPQIVEMAVLLLGINVSGPVGQKEQFNFLTEDYLNLTAAQPTCSTGIDHRQSRRLII
jgi:hypothetical protein